MEKQNLYPILHKVKYNKLKLKTEDKLNQAVRFEENSKNELQLPDSLDNSVDNDSSILNDENDTIIDELFKKNHAFRARWKIMQQRINHFTRENEQLHELLKEERSRTANYQQKLQYIQENQPVFEKLKQAYISLKYNEQKDRAVVEVKERGCQTSVSHRNILEQPTKDDAPKSDFSLRTFDEEVVNFEIEPGFIAIQTKNFNEIKRTVQTLKSLIISQPLSTFVLSENKEAKYRKDIADLFLENKGLKQLVVDQQLELDSARDQLTLRKSSKECNILKRIIAKFNRQIRSCNICNKIHLKPGILNETENKIIGYITTKYELKLQLKQDGSHPATPNTPRSATSKTPRSTTPFYTPRSTRIDDLDLDNKSESNNDPDTYRSCEDEISLDSV